MEQVPPGAPAGPAFESAKRLFFEGLAALQAGRLEDAERAFVASLEAVPGRVSTLLNLGSTASGCTGRSRRSPPPTPCSPPSPATSTRSASAPSPWRAWGCRSRRSPPTTGWSRPNRAWPRCGASAAACCARWAGSTRPTASYAEARARGDDSALTDYFLAGVAGAARRRRPRRRTTSKACSTTTRPSSTPISSASSATRDTRCSPSTCPSRSGASPRRSTSAAAPASAARLLKPRTDRLTGIDLAGGMLDRARALGVYDRLERAEAVAWLEANAETFDLIVSADVLVYIGDLDPLFAAARRALARRRPLRLQHRARRRTATDSPPLRSAAEPALYPLRPLRPRARLASRLRRRPLGPSGTA